MCVGGGGGGGGRGLILKKILFFHLETIIFPFRLDLFPAGGWRAEKRTGIHKSCLTCKNGRKLPDYQVYLKKQQNIYFFSSIYLFLASQKTDVW